MPSRGGGRERSPSGVSHHEGGLIDWAAIATRQPATRKLLSGSEPDGRGEVDGEVHQLCGADPGRPAAHIGEEVAVERRQVVPGATRKLQISVVEEKAC